MAGPPNRAPATSSDGAGLSGRLVILGYGNPSRGDDALGPRLLDRIAALPGHPELITDFQLQVEHAADLEGADLALFIDAGVSCPPPWRLERLKASQDVGYTTHALSPAAVLAVFRQVYGREAPPSFLLTVAGERFELGAGLSAAAAAHLESAAELMERLLADPDPGAWQTLCP